MSVDGTDCRIRKPSPFDSKWFSHKFRGSGIRCEIRICFARGSIVWIHRPFPAGSYMDLSVFRLGLRRVLRKGEKVVADDGYKEDRCVRSVLRVRGQCDRNIHRIIRARDETCNRRLKQFAVLGSTFLHSLRRHGLCFRAVANLIQILISMVAPCSTFLIIFVHSRMLLLEIKSAQVAVE